MADTPKSQPPLEELPPAEVIMEGAPPASLNPSAYLDIVAEPTRATLTIKGSVITAGLVLTRKMISDKLLEQKITSGVDWATVEKMIAGKQYDRAQIIATGTVPKLGKDAIITEKIKIDADTKPVLGKDGKADYKNVDNIHQVKKGDVLAIKTPATQGENGSDIFGKPQPAAPGKDVTFKIGVNTELSPDGMQLVATAGGYVYHLSGAICVGVVYVLKGDVDFNTGNLHYEGDIQVLGNVTTGFVVEAQGHITIEGNVEGAVITSHGGNVTIKSSIFGHNTGKVSAKGDIFLMAAQDLNIECRTGTLHVEKGLRACKVRAHSVKMDHAGCSMVGGEVIAYGEVTVAVLGGEGCQTAIHIVDKDAEAAKEGMKKIDKLLGELANLITPIEMRLKGMKAMASRHGVVISERSKAEMKAVLDQYMAIKGKEKELLGTKERLTTIMKAVTKPVGKFTATEKIVWGVLLEMYGHRLEMSPEDVRKEWVCTLEGLVGRTLITEAPVKKDESKS